MARLPQPGADEGNWGDILNDYLLQIHTAQGQLKQGIISAQHLANGVVTSAKLAGNSVTSSALAPGSVTTAAIAQGAVTSSSLATDAVRSDSLADGSVMPGALALQAGNTANDGNVLTYYGASGKFAWKAASATAGETITASNIGTNGVGIFSAKSGSDLQFKKLRPVSNKLTISDNTAANQVDIDINVNNLGFSPVATSGAYTDLTNKPTIPAQLNATAGTNMTITGTYPNLTFAATSSQTVTDLTTATGATSVTVESSTGTDATISAATTTTAGVMSSTDKTKLDTVAPNATANQTDTYLLDRSHHTGTQAIATVTGLQSALDSKSSSVHLHDDRYYTENEIDTALAGKANVSHSHTIANVTGLQTALDDKLDDTQLGQANGVASLDAGGKVPSTQLPSYVDDALEYSSQANFPASGAAGIIYIAADTNKTYRWSGTVYVEISASPGSTDAVPEGSVNLYYTNARASAAAPVQSVAGKTGAVTLAKADVGLGNVDNTSDLNKPISTATQSALDSKSSSAHLHDDRYYTETEIDTQMAAKASSTHTHTKSQITDFSHVHAAADITSGTLALARIPTGTTSTTVALGNHTHAISGVTGLQTALDGKASTTHGHAIADVTGLQTALDSKLDDSQLSTDVALGTSNTLVPSQNAVKTYVDTHQATVSPLFAPFVEQASGGTWPARPTGSTIVVWVRYPGLTNNPTDFSAGHDILFVKEV